jgi:ubiquinone/menaquinone biosynthesis C-methylase UbiE
MDVRHRFAYSLVEAFANRRDDLLDVGAGEGYGATIVGEWVARYCGIDVSREAVSHATERYADATTRFDHYGGTRFPYPDGSFDIITSFQVIEHVADVDTYVREIRRVSRDGARVLITTPNRRLRLRDGERPWNRYHLREYDADELRQVLETAFSDVQLFGVRGSEAMETLERARLARARRLARLDPFRLRYVLPLPLDTALRSFVRKRGSSAGGPAISIADMWRSSEDADQALDLLAVARP